MNYRLITGGAGGGGEARKLEGKGETRRRKGEKTRERKQNINTDNRKTILSWDRSVWAGRVQCWSLIKTVIRWYLLKWITSPAGTRSRPRVMEGGGGREGDGRERGEVGELARLKRSFLGRRWGAGRGLGEGVGPWTLIESGD